MNQTIASTLFVLFVVAFVHGNNAHGQASWQGVFDGSIDNVPARLTLQKNGSGVTGVVDAQGYRYTIACEVSGSNCNGSVNDPQENVKLPVALVLQGENVTATVEVSDQFGNVQSVAYTFTRTSPEPESKPGGAAESRDQRLVGNWLYSESYTSGDFSMATQYRLIVKADGTYLYGDGKVAGGGDAGSVSSGDGGGYTQGQWKTESSIIYINDGTGWQPYCRYYIEGNSMMMTFDNGRKQIWKRY